MGLDLTPKLDNDSTKVQLQANLQEYHFSKPNPAIYKKYYITWSSCAYPQKVD